MKSAQTAWLSFCGPGEKLLPNLREIDWAPFQIPTRLLLELFQGTTALRKLKAFICLFTILEGVVSSVCPPQYVPCVPIIHSISFSEEVSAPIKAVQLQ